MIHQLLNNEVLQSVFDNYFTSSIIFQLNEDLSTNRGSNDISPLLVKKNLMQLLNRQNIETKQLSMQEQVPTYSAKQIDVLMITTNFFRNLPQKNHSNFFSDAHETLIQNQNNPLKRLSL